MTTGIEKNTIIRIVAKLRPLELLLLFLQFEGTDSE